MLQLKVVTISDKLLQPEVSPEDRQSFWVLCSSPASNPEYQILPRSLALLSHPNQVQTPNFVNLKLLH